MPGHDLAVRALQIFVAAPLLLALGLKAEVPGGKHPTDRVARTLFIAAFCSGLYLAVFCLFGYMSSGDENWLYTGLHGTGPLAAALAVLAFEVHGDTSVAPSWAPALPYSQLPFLVVGLGYLMQYGLRGGKDAVSTVVGLLASWTYLRFFCAHGDGGYGDQRDDFEFLYLLPPPLRVAFRPLEKLASALLLPVVQRVAAIVSGQQSSGGGSSSGNGIPTVGSTAPSAPVTGPASSLSVITPGSAVYGSPAANRQSSDAAAASQRIDLHVHLHGRLGTGSSGGSTVADPVAERRREKALRALDKRLSELRSKIKAGPGSGGGSSASVPMLAPGSPGQV